MIKISIYLHAGGSESATLGGRGKGMKLSRHLERSLGEGSGGYPAAALGVVSPHHQKVCSTVLNRRISNIPSSKNIAMY
jgi:hypothetical protein